MMRRILIVGASLAGLRAAQALRLEGFDGQIQILGEEPHLPYDRPPLSKEFLRGEVELDTIRLRGHDEVGADWLLGEKAAKLDAHARRVTTESGKEIDFDGLVIATGSVPRRLPVLDGPNVVELRTLDDALVLQEAMAERKRIVIVGAGFIGVEVASSALELGAHVEIVSLDPPLAPAGPAVSDAASTLLGEHGAVLHIGRGVDVLPDADLVVSAVGAKPAIDWLQGSGLLLGDGVICDASCASSVDGIVAAGDVARWQNPLFDNTSMRIEHWSNAVEQGQAAARTLLHGRGEDTAFKSVPSFWSDHFGIRLQSVGALQLADEWEVVAGELETRQFIVAAKRQGRLVGAVTYGMGRKLAPYRIKLTRPEPLEAVTQ